MNGLKMMSGDEWCLRPQGDLKQASGTFVLDSRSPENTQHS